MGRLPLHGIRVADLTVVWAGPYGAQLLADWGAEVIRLEPLHVVQPLTRGFEARPTRKQTPFAHHRFPNNEPGARPWNRSNTFNVHARNKLSMTVDLRQREGMAVFEKLIRVSDVIMENNPVSTLEKLGITYD
ncbi:MAG: CoA transferase, partial [Dehalococcoidia bacterium]